MNLPPKMTALPTILIYDGEIKEKNLQGMGLDYKWIMAKLSEKGITNPKDIFLAMLESDGTVYISI